MMEITEVIQTSDVRAASKLTFSLPPQRESVSILLMKYEPMEVTIMRMRMMKIHTSSSAWYWGRQASTMKLMSATPVTP